MAHPPPIVIRASDIYYFIDGREAICLFIGVASCIIHLMRYESVTMYDDNAYSLKLLAALKTPVGYVTYDTTAGSYLDYYYPNTVKVGMETSFSSISVNNPSRSRLWLVSTSGRYRITIDPALGSSLPLSGSQISVFYCNSNVEKNKNGAIPRKCISVSGQDVYSKNVIYVADIDMFLVTDRGLDLFGPEVNWKETSFSCDPTIATFQCDTVSVMEYEEFKDDYLFSLEQRSNALCGELTYIGPEEAPDYLWGIFEYGVTPFRIRKRKVVDLEDIVISGWVLDHHASGDDDTRCVADVIMRMSNLFGDTGFFRRVEPREVILGPHKTKIFPNRESLNAYIAAESYKTFKMKTRAFETITDGELQQLVEQRYLALVEELKIAKDKNAAYDDTIALHKHDAENWKAAFKKLSAVGRDKLEADVEAQQKQEEEERIFKTERLKAEQAKYKKEEKAEGFKFWSTIGKHAVDIAKVIAVVAPLIVATVKVFF